MPVLERRVESDGTRAIITVAALTAGVRELVQSGRCTSAGSRAVAGGSVLSELVHPGPGGWGQMRVCAVAVS